MPRLLLFGFLGVVVCAASGFVLLELSNTSAPAQPIAFDHWQHVTKPDGAQLECTFCHEHADKSAHATIPNTDTCMGCHQSIKTESPEIQELADYAARHQQPPWKRVYWIEAEANEFFTHKPHIRASIECETCHGAVSQSHTVKRETNLTMGWCVDCHKQRGASVDCYVCHR